MMKNLLILTLVAFTSVQVFGQATFTLKTINGLPPGDFLSTTTPAKTFPKDTPVDFVFDYSNLPEVGDPGNARVVIRFYEPGSNPAAFANGAYINGFVANDPATREGTITYTPTTELSNWVLQVFPAIAGTSVGYQSYQVSVQAGATMSITKQTFSNLEIYPNPTNRLLHISDVSDMQHVNILNLLGQNVKTFEAANTLDVSDLKEGVYFLSADNGLTRKFIKR